MLVQEQTISSSSITIKKARTMKKSTTTPSFIQSLMDDLLVEILTKVASHSFHDPYSEKMVCNKFNQLTKNDRIFEHINIRIFEMVNLLTSWSRDEKVFNFLKSCRECNNFEALYSQKMRCYFGYNNSELGIKSLKTVIPKDYQAATYIYGVILVCHGGMKKRKASSFYILSTFRNW